jgi:hypothetical protein
MLLFFADHHCFPTPEKGLCCHWSTEPLAWLDAYRLGCFDGVGFKKRLTVLLRGDVIVDQADALG